MLASFGRGEAEALRAYRTYMAEGMAQGRRPELIGGGLVRSLGGWAEVRAMRRRHAASQGDERVLGSGDFVVRLLELWGTRCALLRLRPRREGLEAGPRR